MPPEKLTGRKGKAKETEVKSAGHEVAESLAGFTLPNSLPCSEVEFPVLIPKKRKKTSWKAILAESEKEIQEIEEYAASKKPVELKSPFMKTECDYIRDEVFTQLLPALEETLNKAKIWNALSRQKCLFNGVDHVVQVLWNNNPRHPNRKAQNPDLHVFNMPWVQEWLRYHPRPHYPMSWLWTEEYAATLIQKSVRQFFVQREEEVQEMRDFWRKLEVQKHVKEMASNPFLAKKFASQPALNRKW